MGAWNSLDSVFSACNVDGNDALFLKRRRIDRYAEYEYFGAVF